MAGTGRGGNSSGAGGAGGSGGGWGDRSGGRSGPQDPRSGDGSAGAPYKKQHTDRYKKGGVHAQHAKHTKHVGVGKFKLLNMVTRSSVRDSTVHVTPACRVVAQTEPQVTHVASPKAATVAVQGSPVQEPLNPINPIIPKPLNPTVPAAPRKFKKSKRQDRNRRKNLKRIQNKIVNEASAQVPVPDPPTVSSDVPIIVENIPISVSENREPTAQKALPAPEGYTLTPATIA